MIDIWPLVNVFIGGILVSVAVIGQSYLRKKGENLATKKDIAAITHEIEQVRVQYANQLESISQENRLRLEQTKLKNQLSVAALDRRLDAYQQAFVLWWEFVGKADSEKEIDVEKYHVWWVKNCLYLDEETEEKFQVAYTAAENRRFLKEARDIEGLKKNRQEINDAGKAIREAVNLPRPVVGVVVGVKEET